MKLKLIILRFTLLFNFFAVAFIYIGVNPFLVILNTAICSIFVFTINCPKCGRNLIRSKAFKDIALLIIGTKRPSCCQCCNTAEYVVQNTSSRGLNRLRFQQNMLQIQIILGFYLFIFSNYTENIKMTIASEWFMGLCMLDMIIFSYSFYFIKCPICQKRVFPIGIYTFPVIEQMMNLLLARDTITCYSCKKKIVLVQDSSKYCSKLSDKKN